MTTRLLSIALLGAVTVNASAFDFKVAGIYYNVLSEERREVEVTNPIDFSADPDNYESRYRGDLSIPPTVTHGGVEYEVVAVGDNAFRMGKIRSVTLPATVKSIGENAFGGTGVETVELPDGITEIGMYAFSDCDRLSTIALPESLTGIPYGMFHKSALEEITLPPNVVEIGGDAFGGCRYLRSVTLPQGLERIGELAFSNCGSLAGIGIPASVASIGEQAFQDCAALGTLSLPDNLKVLDRQILYGCTELRDLRIPEGLTAIDDYALAGCDRMEGIVLPSTLESVGMGALSGTGLRRICSRAQTPPAYVPHPPAVSDNVLVFADVVLRDATLYVPTGTSDLYRHTAPWSAFVDIRESDLPGITDAKYTNYFGEEGTEWVVEYSSDGDPSVPETGSCRHLWLEGGTELLGRHALKMWSRWDGLDSPTLLTHVAVEGGRVFFLQNDGSEWCQVYDFDLTPGETAQIYGATPVGLTEENLKPLTVTCTAVDPVEWAPDFEMMELTTHKGSGPNEQWIRGIGSRFGVVENDFFQLVGRGSSHIAEVRSNGQTVYRYGSGAGAYATTTVTSLRIGRGSIRVEGDPSPEVYSICGERMAGTAGNFPDLPAGVYVVVAGGTPKKVIVP